MLRGRSGPNVWKGSYSQTNPLSANRPAANFSYTPIIPMSSSSSSPPSPAVPLSKKQKKKTKVPKAVAPSNDGKDEGTNPEWNYVPPEGIVLFDHTTDSGDFDWDAVRDDDDLELWLVRVPDSVSLSPNSTSV